MKYIEIDNLYKLLEKCKEISSFYSLTYAMLITGNLFDLKEEVNSDEIVQLYSKLKYVYNSLIIKYSGITDIPEIYESREFTKEFLSFLRELYSNSINILKSQIYNFDIGKSGEYKDIISHNLTNIKSSLITYKSSYILLLGENAIDTMIVDIENNINKINTYGSETTRNL